MLTRKRWKELTAREKKAFKRLYLTAFPKEERVPWGLLSWMNKRGKCLFSAYLEEEKFVGLTVTISHETFCYLFFFAVEEAERGRGYGSDILERTFSLQKTPLILDIEKIQPSCNLEERKKRKRFYLHNGFLPAGFFMNLTAWHTKRSTAGQISPWRSSAPLFPSG